MGSYMVNSEGRTISAILLEALVFSETLRPTGLSNAAKKVLATAVKAAEAETSVSKMGFEAAESWVDTQVKMDSIKG